MRPKIGTTSLPRAGHAKAAARAPQSSRARTAAETTKRLLVQALHDHRHALAAGHAHGLQAVLLVERLEVVQQRRHDAGAGLAERVAERDRSAVRVELVERDVALVHDRDDLG